MLVKPEPRPESCTFDGSGRERARRMAGGTGDILVLIDCFLRGELEGVNEVCSLMSLRGSSMSGLFANL